MSIRLMRTASVLAASLAILLLSLTSALAQTKGASVLPTGGGKMLLDPADTAILLLDHQAGLFQTVKDVPVDDLRRNVVMLARLATLLKIPVITTASEPNGPNGPIMPEIAEFAPNATYVPRKGEVNAWDNEDFVKTVQSDRSEDADHGRRLDQRVRDVPGARRYGRRLQGVRGDGCLRRPERDGIARRRSRDSSKAG